MERGVENKHIYSNEFWIKIRASEGKIYICAVLTEGALAHLARARHWQCRGERFESAMLHNSAVYISKLAYSATPLPREEAGDIKRKGPRHHVATLPPGWLFCGVYNVIQLRSCRPQNKPLAFKKSKLTDNSVL